MHELNWRINTYRFSSLDWSRLVGYLQDDERAILDGWQARGSQRFFGSRSETEKAICWRQSSESLHGMQVTGTSAAH